MRSLFICKTCLMRRLSRLFTIHGFTLVELLVVIVVLAILLAVALPSYLGHRKKAQYSVAQQELTLSYRVARAASVSDVRDSGFITAAPALASAIQASEPELTVSTASSDAAAYAAAQLKSGPSHVVVSGDSTADNYSAYVRSDSGEIFCITGPAKGQHVIKSGSADCGGTDVPAGPDGGPPVNAQRHEISYDQNSSKLSAWDGAWTGTDPISLGESWQQADTG